MIAIKNTVTGCVVATANKMNEAIQWLSNHSDLISTHGIFPDAEASAEESALVGTTVKVGGLYE